MKLNPLLNDLFRGEWLLDVNWISSAAPMVDNLLKGMPNVQKLEEQDSCLSIMDDSGRRLRPGTEIPTGSIAVVSMVGAAMKYGTACTYGATDIVEELSYANSNPNIKAIILKLDGPGGAVSAIGPFLQFALEKKKPIIGLADACMSLHYWVAISVCDYIMADNDISARFGSVGVVSQFMDAKKHWEEKGYVFHEVYADVSGDKNKVFKLALEGNYEAIKAEHLNPMARKFQNAVRAGRPKLREEAGVLTGATYDADKSLGLGVIDGIGSFKTAVNIANMYAELKTQL